jgi:hypothetical protein
MNKSIAEVLHREFFARGSQVSIMVEEAKHVPVDTGKQAVASDVKFALVYK